jgi:hypothetical protein
MVRINLTIWHIDRLKILTHLTLRYKHKGYNFEISYGEKFSHNRVKHVDVDLILLLLVMVGLAECGRQSLKSLLLLALIGVWLD